ncbi:MAG: hypothetical protein ABIQ93_06845, partial [Saprospiraceae bacterium]
ADFAAAKAAGTIPALNSFIAKKYPREQYEKEANLLLQKLENKVKTLLKDAAQFREDPGTACDLLRQAAAIAPNGTEVLKRQRELKCK